MKFKAVKFLREGRRCGALPTFWDSNTGPQVRIFLTFFSLPRGPLTGLCLGSVERAPARSVLDLSTRSRRGWRRRTPRPWPRAPVGLVSRGETAVARAGRLLSRVRTAPRDGESASGASRRSHRGRRAMRKSRAACLARAGPRRCVQPGERLPAARGAAATWRAIGPAPLRTLLPPLSAYARGVCRGAAARRKTCARKRRVVLVARPKSC
jgi:hypothetical protein